MQKIFSGSSNPVPLATVDDRNEPAQARCRGITWRRRSLLESARGGGCVKTPAFNLRVENPP
jgi:hypothetical protein